MTSGTQQVLRKCRLILTGQRTLLSFSYTLDGPFLVLETTKEAHPLLGLTLANHPAWVIRVTWQKEPQF